MNINKIEKVDERIEAFIDTFNELKTLKDDNNIKKLAMENFLCSLNNELIPIKELVLNRIENSGDLKENKLFLDYLNHLSKNQLFISPKRFKRRIWTKEFMKIKILFRNTKEEEILKGLEKSIDYHGGLSDDLKEYYLDQLKECSNESFIILKEFFEEPERKVINPTIESVYKTISMISWRISSIKKNL